MYTKNHFLRIYKKTNLFLRYTEKSMLVFFGNHLLFNVHFFISSHTELNSSSKFTALYKSLQTLYHAPTILPCTYIPSTLFKLYPSPHPKSVRWVLTVGTEFGMCVPRNFALWARTRGSESYVVDVQLTFF